MLFRKRTVLDLTRNKVLEFFTSNYSINFVCLTTAASFKLRPLRKVGYRPEQDIVRYPPKILFVFTEGRIDIKSLGSVLCNTSVVLDCQSSLNGIAEGFQIQILWVSRHSNIIRRGMVDKLALALQILP